MTIRYKIIWISTMVASLGMADTLEDREAMPVEGLAPSVIDMGDTDEMDSEHFGLSKPTHTTDNNVTLEMHNGIVQRKIEIDKDIPTTSSDTDTIDAEGLAPAFVDMLEL